MGVFDFVKNGVREMMIARPDNLKGLIVYKHPDQNFPMYSQLTIDSDECAVFFKDGRFVGVMPPGRHTMQTQNIPFLNQLVNNFTGGQVFISEIYFVTTRPIRGITFGGSCGEIIDQNTGLEVPLRIFGEMAVVVTDPGLFITNYTGQAAQGNNDQILDWIKGKFMNSVVTVLQGVCEQAQKSVNQIINNRELIANAFMQKTPALDALGVRICDIGKIEPNIPEDMLQQLRAAQAEVAQAQREVRKKQIAIAGAQADAQAKQFELDQKFQQDARYVQQLAGSYQNYAAGNALMGAGQGMATHGVGDGIAGMGAQMAVGVGVGNMMAGGFSQQAGPQFHPGGAPQGQQGQAQPPVPGQAPQFPGAGAAPVTCGKCGVKQPGGKFCAECGNALAMAKRFCTGCGQELAGGAKFCANCGTSAAAPPVAPPAAPAASAP